MNENTGSGPDKQPGKKPDIIQQPEGGKDLGQQIGESVRIALQTGDLSSFRNIGTSLSDAMHTGFSPNGNSKPGHPYKAQPARPPWMGKGRDGNVPAPVASGPVQQLGPSRFTGLAPQLLGALGFVVFGLTAGGVALSGTLFPFLAITGLGGVFGALALVCGGISLFGRSKRKLSLRIRRYYELLAAKNVQTFAELAQGAGVPEEQLRKDVKKGMKKGILPDVRVDGHATCLMYGEDAYQLYLDSQRSLAERQALEAERVRRMEDPQKAALERFRTEGGAMLRKIQEANDAIPGEEISEKLGRLESTISIIFAYVEKHPEKLPDTRKFMDYYLPTTLKLVEKYQQYEENEVQVANIVRAKEEIETALDTINVGFLNLLENLYHDDTLDVSTDIEVLQAMLAQEGLTGRKFEIETDKEALPL